jgi:hypothetical protein
MVVRLGAEIRGRLSRQTVDQSVKKLVHMHLNTTDTKLNVRISRKAVVHKRNRSLMNPPKTYKQILQESYENSGQTAQ